MLRPIKDENTIKGNASVPGKRERKALLSAESLEEKQSLKVIC
jgi:hypothetical protein